MFWMKLLKRFKVNPRNFQPVSYVISTVISDSDTICSYKALSIFQ